MPILQTLLPPGLAVMQHIWRQGWGSEAQLIHVSPLVACQIGVERKGEKAALSSPICIPDIKRIASVPSQLGEGRRGRNYGFFSANLKSIVLVPADLGGGRRQ